MAPQIQPQTSRAMVTTSGFSLRRLPITFGNSPLIANTCKPTTIAPMASSPEPVSAPSPTARGGSMARTTPRYGTTLTNPLRKPRPAPGGARRHLCTAPARGPAHRRATRQSSARLWPIPVLAVHGTLRLTVDLVPQLEHLQFVGEGRMPPPQRLQLRWRGQQGLLLRHVEAEQAGQGVERETS